mmetsp:Transcript_38381/g.69168  ORF Transcript_38381/g.69168 Transcript_38381/m.69168 type:complete len:432 (+) Transcript_38381:54-1349(+)
MFTMKPSTTPWLLALATMAMLPPNSYGVKPLPPLHSPSPMISSDASARCHCTAFIHRSNDPINSRSKFKPSSKITASPSAIRSVSTQLAMSSSPISSSSQRTSPSPWSPGKWKITLDFGREDSDSSERNDNSQITNLLGEDWGSNGVRLGLSFEIMANAETTNTKRGEPSVQMTWLGGKPTGTVECIPQKNKDEDYCASYINEKGQQDVQISSGQWRVEPPLPLLPSNVNVLPGQASTLRFDLALLTAIQRNTISFPQDQLLLLQSNTFRTQQYPSGVRTLLPYQYAKDIAQQQLEEQLNHETGDRRLDGGDIFETLGGYKDVAELVLERDQKRRRWKDIEGVLPKLDSSIDTTRKVDISRLLEDEKRWGIWPGDTELMTIERGVVLAVVAKESKQKKGFFPWMQDGGGVEEPVIVGKWSALPIFDDDMNN